MYTIRRKEGECYQTLFQRILAHLEDNLLTVASGILYDGAAVAVDEVMSDTTERLAVFIWLQLFDNRLPGYICRTYTPELSTHSLKDLQPQIVDNMESILSELNTQEDILINYSRSSLSQPTK